MRSSQWRRGVPAVIGSVFMVGCATTPQPAAPIAGGPLAHRTLTANVEAKAPIKAKVAAGLGNLVNELKLDAAQQTKLKAVVTKHREALKKLQSPGWMPKFIGALGAPNLDLTTLKGLLTEKENIRRQALQSMVAMLTDVREILTEDQRDKATELLNQQAEKLGAKIPTKPIEVDKPDAKPDDQKVEDKDDQKVEDQDDQKVDDKDDDKDDAKDVDKSAAPPELPKAADTPLIPSEPVRSLMGVVEPALVPAAKPAIKAQPDDLQLSAEQKGAFDDLRESQKDRADALLAMGAYMQDGNEDALLAGLQPDRSVEEQVDKEANALASMSLTQRRAMIAALAGPPLGRRPIAPRVDDKVATDEAVPPQQPLPPAKPIDQQ